jgi:hypothetical protein
MVRSRGIEPLAFTFGKASHEWCFNLIFGLEAYSPELRRNAKPHQTHTSLEHEMNELNIPAPFKENSTTKSDANTSKPNEILKQNSK